MNTDSELHSFTKKLKLITQIGNVHDETIVHVFIGSIVFFLLVTDEA